MNLKLTLTIVGLLICSACSQQPGNTESSTTNSPSVAEKTNTKGKFALENPGFEASADSVVGWKLTQHAGVDAYEMGVDTSTAAEGKNSFRIKRIVEQFWGMVSQRLPLPMSAGKQIELTAKVKGENLGDRGFIVMLVFRQVSGQYISRMKSKPLTGSGDWQTVKLSGVIPPQTGLIDVSGTLEDEGVAWFDDVNVVVTNK